MAVPGRSVSRRAVAPLAIAVPLVLLDSLTKRLVVDALGPGSPTHRLALTGDWLAIAYAENRGAAFGMLQGQSAPLTAAALLLVLGVAVAYLRQAQPSPLLVVAAGLVLGGGIGNLWDRLRLGYVVDFVAVGPWPNFNLADSAITVGAIVFAIDLLRAPEVPTSHAAAGADEERRTTVAQGNGTP